MGFLQGKKERWILHDFMLPVKSRRETPKYTESLPNG